MCNVESRGAAMHMIDPMPTEMACDARGATPHIEERAGTAVQRWIVPELRMLPLAARRCLVRNPLNGTSLELSAGEYAVLSTCEGGHTLADHEANAASRLSAPPEHRPAIRELLERCARRGLLMSLHELVSRFGSTGESVAPRFAGILSRA